MSGKSAVATQPRQGVDWPVDIVLLGVIVALLSLSLIFVGSASVAIGEKVFDNPFHYLIRQSVFVAVG
ncbi:MAG: hypothetical protein ACPG4N_09040, partial [Gammaproteobacteria bacterium]